MVTVEVARGKRIESAEQRTAVEVAREVGQPGLELGALGPGDPLAPGGRRIVLEHRHVAPERARGPRRPRRDLHEGRMLLETHDLARLEGDAAPGSWSQHA